MVFITTLTVTILLHHMCISTTYVSLVMLDTKIYMPKPVQTLKGWLNQKGLKVKAKHEQGIKTMHESNTSI